MSDEKLKQAAKEWVAGSYEIPVDRVEPFMGRVSQALDRSGENLTTDQRTDIYNRAYEAIYEVFKVYDEREKIKNVLATKKEQLP